LLPSYEKEPKIIIKSSLCEKIHWSGDNLWRLPHTVGSPECVKTKSPETNCQWQK